VTDEDPIPDDAELVWLSFKFAGRISDSDRDSLGLMAAGAQWDQVIEILAAVIVHDGAPATTEELEIVNNGLRWLDRPVVGGTIDPAVTVAEDAVEEHLRRWRFEPAAPSGEPYEQATIPILKEVPTATGLVTAWRIGPDGSHIRAYCVVCTPQWDPFWGPQHVWGHVHSGWIRSMGNQWPTSLGVILEVAQEGRPWTIYHRRLLEAAQPVWTRDAAG
jgi:hypothetical protein